MKDIFKILLALGIFWLCETVQAEPLKPIFASKEEIYPIIDEASQYQMCWIKNITAVSRDEMQTRYSVQMSNNQNRECTLSYVVWRESVANFPDGSPAPSDYCVIRVKNMGVTSNDCSCK